MIVEEDERIGDSMTGRKECNDKNCFVHGKIKIHGTATLRGKVVSTKPSKTAIVMRETMKRIPKYNRYARTHSKIPVHNPPCIDAKVGDLVEIAPTRRISKTKSWTIVRVIETEK